MSDWESLASKIRDCQACSELASTRSNVVVGHLPVRGARLLLVGEAPGAHEDLTGFPFVGKAGQLLDELLDEVGLGRDRVAIANVLKCRPPDNRKPTSQEIANCRPWLMAQLAIVQPCLVVALGSTAAEWFFGRGAKIGELRGRVLEQGGRRVLATYHPSAALRFGPHGMPRTALRDDLALAAQEVAGKAFS